MKRQATFLEKIFAIHTMTKDLYPELIKKFYNVIISQPNKNEENILAN